MRTCRDGLSTEQESSRFTKASCSAVQIRSRCSLTRAGGSKATLSLYRAACLIWPSQERPYLGN